MAAVDPGLLNTWVSDQLWTPCARPRVGSTGTLDAWVSDQIWLDIFAEATAVTGVREGPFRRVFQPVFHGAFG